MVFSLPIDRSGVYELLAEFVTFPGYGIAQLSVDGQPLGVPFDAYAPELDVSELISFGRVELAAGTRAVGVKLVGKNDNATGYFISVRNFVLRPVGE